MPPLSDTEPEVQSWTRVRANIAFRLFMIPWATVYFWACLVIWFLQIVPITTVLVLTYGKPCDQNLWGYLLGFDIYLVLKIVSAVLNRAYPDIPRRWSESRTGYVLYILTEMVEFSFYILLFTGSYLTNHCKTCQKTTPLLYYATYSLILFGIMILMMPALLLITVFSCLPSLLNSLRRMREAESTYRETATLRAISDIPTAKYSPATLFYGAGRLPIQAEDARCTICLGQYETGDELRLLECRHHFHMRCVDEWFGVSANCPLCMRPIVPELNLRLVRQGSGIHGSALA